MRRPTKDEVYERRSALAERIRAGGLPLTEAVRQMRHALGMPQGEFAGLVGLTKRQLAEIEQGVANPTVATVQRIGRLFGLEVGFVKAAPGSMPPRKIAPAARAPDGPEGGDESFSPTVF